MKVSLVTSIFYIQKIWYQDLLLTNNFQFRFIGEESVAAGEKCELTAAPTWIIDPVDGTMNFVHSFPHSCISLAVLYNKEVEIGIIYNPVLEQMYTAQLGKGAFLNDKPIHVSEQTGMWIVCR